MPPELEAIEIDTARILLPRFPVLVDTGFSGTFLMRVDHVAWTGYQLNKEFKSDGKRSLIRRAIDPSNDEASYPVFKGSLFIHANVPGTNDSLLEDVDPVKLELWPGFVVYYGENLEIPVLGLRALRQNKVRIALEPGRSDSYSMTLTAQD